MKNSHANCSLCGGASIYCHQTYCDSAFVNRWRIECKKASPCAVSAWKATLRLAVSVWNRTHGKRKRG